METLAVEVGPYSLDSEGQATTPEGVPGYNFKELPMQYRKGITAAVSSSPRSDEAWLFSGSKCLKWSLSNNRVVMTPGEVETRSWYQDLPAFFPSTYLPWNE